MPRSTRWAMPTANALAESMIGLYKTELIKPGRPWRGRDEVEYETTDYRQHQPTMATATN